jgi:type IV pilus assembly protein PilY1
MDQRQIIKESIMKHLSLRNKPAWMLAAALLASAPALHAATTDIYSAPPQATATGIKPNIMFLLDDSGSMTWDHLGDNVGYGGTLSGAMGGSGWTGGMCRLGTSSNTSNFISEPPSNPATKTDCFGSGSSITLETMKESGVPYFAKEFNGIFYNPTITYTPPVDYDGTNTTYKSWDNSAGHLWNAVRDNPFPGGPATTKNLDPSSATKNFPEQIFCDGSQSGPPATFDAVHCRRNVMTNATFSVTLANSPSGARAAGVTIITTVTFPVGTINGCVATDKATIVNSGFAQNNGTFTIAAPTNTSFTYTWTVPVGGLTVPAALGITATASPAASACNIPIVKLLSSGTATTATFPIPHGCAVGEKITINGAAAAGHNVGGSNPAFFTVASVPDERALTYTTTVNNGGQGQEGVDALSGVFVARLGGDPTSVPAKPVCAGTKSNYSTSTTVPPLMQGYPELAAGKFFTHVLLNSNPHYYTIGANEYCTDENFTKCQASISETIGVTPTAYTFPATVRYCTTTAEVSKNPAANIPSSLTSGSETGCHRVYGLHSTSATLWPGLARYGYFTRVDIVTPTTTTYPKVSTRSDCAGAVGPTGCSYNEETTNFANWYAYYRTRIQMVKSAAGLAFKNLSSNYRVGFNSLNAAGASQWLPVAPFDVAAGGQKQTWFTKLYGIVASGGTPSRAALARIGRYYGGLKTTAAAYMTDDPMEASCQQNFTFFATDGFWTNNGGAASAGIKLDGTIVGDQDGVAGTPRPFLDAFASTSDDSRGTLADTAYYYYITDLRDATHKPTNSLGVNVTLNNVPPSTADPAKWQHMSTFTMGLGLDSTLIYKPGYATPGTAPDYDAIVNGTACPFSTPCKWPAPFSGAVSAVDDLWHAAVNGHGTYFSARNPAAVVSGLASSFSIITQRSGVVAAPATSNPVATQNDNFIFNTTFTTLSWYSELNRRTIDPATGAVSTTPDWAAQALLDAKTTASSDTRTIFTFDGGTANKLKNFLWANLTATEKTYFDGTLGGKNLLGQWSILSGAQQTQCDAGGTTCGEKLVNFHRGQRGFETTALGNNTLAPDPGTNSLFRHRDHIFGDSVNAQAVYVKASAFAYGDQGYLAFKSANLTRQGTVYLAANDGMLHAFNSDTGAESWAYIPSMVMPNMWHLADFDYANNHRYFVDGTPVTGDICTNNCTISSATWATILVGGLNAGGRGFYALDITNPASPKALWELKSTDASGNPAACIPSVNNVPQTPVPANTFSDCDIGLSFGNPIITKRSDGKWVVLVTSGYNNVAPGTGGGFLYIVDALTGAILNKTATLILNPPGFAPGMINAGNTTTPSGFTRINAFAASANTDNTTMRVYGGDLNGNLWRIDGQFAPNTLASGFGLNHATLLAILGTANGLNTQGIGDQPITTRPTLGQITSGTAGPVEMVYVGTGRFLGSSDVSNLSQQTFYGIKDPLGTFAGWSAVHTNPNMVKQTLTQAPNATDPTEIDRFTTANAVTFSPGATGTIGWFIDFNPGGASPGERSNTDPKILFGTLGFTTNAPNANTCDFGGKGFTYFLDYTTGGPSPDSTTGTSGRQYDALLSGVEGIGFDQGNKYEFGFSRGDRPDQPGISDPFKKKGLSSGKRINWRELNF